MDKQQATQHILNRLNAGYQSEEITEELSRILKAPPAITQRFVDQVIASQPKTTPAIPTPKDEGMPDWMEPIVVERPVEPEADRIYSPPPSTLHSDLPPGLQALINENSPDADIRGVKPFVTTPEFPETDLPTQARFVASAQGSENLEGEDSSQNIDLEKISEYVLGQLKKQRRHNDIVEAVCHQTGWHWNKSQRFVARVKTKNHEQLQAGHNRVIIIVGIGIILVGLVMALNGAAAIADYAKLAAFARTNPSVLLNISPQALFFALVATVTGIGMIVGGVYGVSRALTNN